MTFTEGCEIKSGTIIMKYVECHGDDFTNQNTVIGEVNGPIATGNRHFKARPRYARGIL
jgi:hypothetical protein